MLAVSRYISIKIGGQMRKKLIKNRQIRLKRYEQTAAGAPPPRRFFSLVMLFLSKDN
jgi:hypothetical protein